MSEITKPKQWLRLNLKFSTKSLICSAGMPRSGSTLLFNILREILLTKWSDKLSSGWSDDIMELPEGRAYLIKTHELDYYYNFRAQFKFYTYRDIRVATVSAMRKFNVQPSMEFFDYVINQYMIAKQNCDLMIKYDDLIANPHFQVQQIARILNIKVDTQKIVTKTFYLKPPSGDYSGRYSKKTLLHKNHFTHTKDDDWRSIFSQELQENINAKFSWWFEECGYPKS